MSRIALVEDHARLADLVRTALDDVAIGVDVYDGVATAWAALRENAYAAAVIDRGLADGDGLALVRRLRSVGNGIPCLMLTARDALHDRIEGLESGADDYLAKPFPMAELVARVRALVRRPPAVRPSITAFKDMEVQAYIGCLRCGEDSITLAPAELQIMLTLLEAAGKSVRRSSLELAAWGTSTAVTPNALDVALHRLRRKLAAVGSHVRILNIRGFGYALA